MASSRPITTPVSYTHLDVYKRQQFTRGYGLAFGYAERKAMGMALVDRAPVSYTHLDVYKRQVIVTSPG